EDINPEYEQGQLQVYSPCDAVYSRWHVTSCVRLDKTNNPFSVGGETLNFAITESESQHTRIFIDSERMKKFSKGTASEAT
ncbi:hypothetical protein BGZ76_010825, partial [Entomortierella beljakovae]